MEKLFLINESNSTTRIAITENGRPVEYYYESSEKAPEDSIILGKVVEHAPALDAYFIDVGTEKKAYLPEKNLYGINIKQNSIMAFQILHGERGSKGMYLSCRLLITGKYCICGNIERNSRISSKIDNNKARERLKHVLESNKNINEEIIFRTIAQNASSEEIEEDLRENLHKLELIKLSEGSPGEILCRPETIIDKILKKVNFTEDSIYFDNIDTFNEYYKKYNSNGMNKCFKHYNKEYDIFDFFSISTKLREAFERKVRLKNGGQIVFDYTEAMCVIDVNSSKNSSPGNLSETAYKTNIEAAKEIAIQLRLRNIGGIIIIDFIETNEESRKKIDEYFKEHLNADSRRLKIGGFTNLGNYELVRSRKGRRLEIGQY